MSETVGLQALCGETCLEDALRSWQGFVRLAGEEMAVPPDLRLAPGAPVEPDSFFAEHGFVGPIRPIGCYFLSNITFAGVLYPFSDGRLIDDGSHLSMVCASWLAKFPTHRPGMRGDLPSTVIDGMVLPVAGPGHQTYGHWIIDFLPRLAIARALLGYRFRDVRFLVLQDTPTWAFALMEGFFGIREKDCIRFEPGNDEFLCPHVVYPTYASTYPFLLHSFIERFYRPYAARHPGGRRLCVRRRTGSGDHREFERRAAFEARAAAEGYELVDPQAFPIREQMALFRSAAVVIGEYGSALHNSVFSAPGTLFGVLNAPGVEQTRLCAAFRQPMVYMPSGTRSGHWSLSDQQLDSFFATVAGVHGDPPPDRTPPAASGPSSMSEVTLSASAFEAEVRLQGHIFKAESIYGTVLAANFAARELIHATAVGPDRPLAMVYVPVVSPFAFILADNPGLLPFAPRFRGLNGPIIVTRRRLMPEGTVAFCDPLRLTYLIAHSDIAADGTGMAAFFGSEVGDWQHFKLTGIVDRPLPLTIVHQIELIERVLGTPPTHILDLLNGAPDSDRRVIASLLTDTLLPSDAELFVAYLLDDISRIKALASVCPGDPWAEIGLPALWRFLKARRARFSVLPSPHGKSAPAYVAPPTATSIGPDLDRLATDGAQGDYASLAHRCTAVARNTVAPVKDLCIIVPVRNDGLYLIDWIAYHKSIGVDRIFLYTNDNVDGSDQLLRALSAAGEISLIENFLPPNGVSPVYKAYGHALSVVPEILDYRWCAILDSDELIGFERASFDSLKQYVAWQERQPVDAIVLNWLLFGSSGALRWNESSLPNRFRDRYSDAHIKTIFRPRMFFHAMPHFPLAQGAGAIVWRDAQGNPHPAATPHSPAPKDGPAWIAHYFYRSFEEFVWKFADGRGDVPLQEVSSVINIPDEFMAGFVRQFNELPLTRDDRMLAFDKETAVEARRLRTLPGVDEAMSGITAHYRDRSAALEHAIRELRPAASPTQAAFFDLFLAG